MERVKNNMTKANDQLNKLRTSCLGTKWYAQRYNAKKSLMTRRSVFQILRGLMFKEHNHKQEKARRVKQMERGQISTDQWMKDKNGVRV